MWARGVQEYSEQFPAAYEQLGSLGDTHSGAMIPLVYAGEVLGVFAMGFLDPARFGVIDQAFTLLLAQDTATALHRARTYDVEHEKRRQAEVVARAREDVLGVVAHDLRNPLNLIHMTAQMLLTEPPVEKRRELLEIGERAVAQMNRLIGDLLDAVRLQAGRLSLEIAPVSCHSIVDGAAETFVPLAQGRGITLEYRCDDSTIHVCADFARIQQVLGNLIGNALKFTPSGGTVLLVASREGSIAVIKVSDTGPGIPADNIPHLFEQFWQARQGDRRGAGLGLAIAKGIVEAHGGNIWAESTEGAGSTFSFTLPIIAAKSRAAS
jgi:signal transduction histidine kinase